MIPERIKEKFGFGVLLAATLVVVIPVLFIIWLIISKGWSAQVVTGVVMTGLQTAAPPSPFGGGFPRPR